MTSLLSSTVTNSSSCSEVSLLIKSGRGFPRVSGNMIAMSPAENDVAPKTIGGTTVGVLSCKEEITNDNRS